MYRLKARYNDFHSKENILVIMEDSGYAYKYMRNALQNRYSNINIDLVQMNGINNGIKAIKDFISNDCYNKKYSLTLVLYDGGIQNDNLDILDFKTTVLEMCSKIQYKIAIFYPSCFEELIFQCQILRELTNNKGLFEDSDLYKSYYNIMTGNQKDIDFETMMREYSLNGLITDAKSVEQFIEKEAYRTLKNTKYIINHDSSKLGPCWSKECTLCKFFIYGNPLCIHCERNNNNDCESNCINGVKQRAVFHCEDSYKQKYNNKVYEIIINQLLQVIFIIIDSNFNWNIHGKLIDNVLSCELIRKNLELYNIEV